MQEILSFEGFTSPWYKQLLFLVLGVCTFGVLFLVAKWSLRVRTALRLSRCPLKQAKFVRVTVSWPQQLLYYCSECSCAAAPQASLHSGVLSNRTWTPC